MNDPKPDNGTRWAVHRIDDNGNVFVVKGQLTRDEAERLVTKYEVRGHKQTYWIERDAG